MKYDAIFVSYDESFKTGSKPNHNLTYHRQEVSSVKITNLSNPFIIPLWYFGHCMFDVDGYKRLQRSKKSKKVFHVTILDMLRFLLGNGKKKLAILVLAKSAKQLTQGMNVARKSSGFN